MRSAGDFEPMSSEKTEQPTPKRLRESREKGQVAKSQDVPSALTVMAVAVYLLAMSSDMLNTLLTMGEAPMLLMDRPFEEALPLAVTSTLLCALRVALPLIGSQIIIGNFFQAIGKARLAIFLSLPRQMLFLLPFLLVLPRFWGQDGVWASLPLADVLSFIVTLLFIRRFLKYYRLKNRHYLVPGTGKA